jgi:hypothetical protein
VSIPWDTTTVPNGSQTLTATVRDAAGNTGSAANTLTVQNGPQPLTASFTNPAAGATVSGAAVTIGMAASGGTPAYTYKLTIDGTQVFTTTTSAGTASFSWNTTGATNGTHTLGLTVTDTAGGSSTATRSVTVSNNGPVASFTSPAAGATVNGTIAVNMSATGGVTPYTYTLTIDGTQVFTTTTSATTATYSWNTTTVGDGSHTLGLTVRGSNAATGTATRTVTVANNPGGTFQVFITDPTAGQVVSGTKWVIIWTQGAATGAKTYTMTVGGTTVWSQSTSDAPATLPWVTTQTPNGPQTLVVTVRDAANATGTSSVAVTVQNP